MSSIGVYPELYGASRGFSAWVDLFRVYLGLYRVLEGSVPGGVGIWSCDTRLDSSLDTVQMQGVEAPKGNKTNNSDNNTNNRNTNRNNKSNNNKKTISRNSNSNNIRNNNSNNDGNNSPVADRIGPLS